MRTPQKLMIGLALSGLLFGIGACSSSSPVGSTPTPTPSDSATTSAPPTMTSPATATDGNDPPLPARLNTGEGAQEFAKYYIQQLNRSFQVPDSRLLLPLSRPECKSCTALIDTAREYEQRKQRYEGTPMEITSVLLQKFSDVEGAVVLVYAQQPSATVVDASGATIRMLPASAANSAFTLKYSSGWTVVTIQSLIGG